jgi:2,3-bisphosphoglycerate-independent phosphoglycerate mutase
LKPIVLLVLDGWGISPKKEGNAILNTSTPNYNYLLSHFPHSELAASGAEVGLPLGLMGNSEVGHLNLGAGRVVIQKLSCISNTIADGSFFTNPVFFKAISNVKEHNSRLHIFGLVSDGCVHSSPDHVQALLDLAAKNNISELVVHPILDGRDTPPRSALRFMNELQESLEQKLRGRGKIGVVCGRYYAMDRDQRWERIEKYWRALVLGEGFKAGSAVDAVEQGYKRGENDEFILPTIVNPVTIQENDSVICFNFRPDRVRQISRALTQSDFTGFTQPVSPHIYYVCLTEYDASLNLPIAFTPADFPSQDMHNTLPEFLSCHHIGQLHTAETEKYAHVTYFFNGGIEKPNPGEERTLVPSAKVATYDLQPVMKTPEICQVACDAIMSEKYPFIILNFANPDMVGHTGMLEAAIEAVQSVDEAFGKLLEAIRSVQGTLLITADHGNVEQMIDEKTGQAHTAHTTNPVPFIVADFSGAIKNGRHLANGRLADVAPTILDIMRIEKPAEMTGHSLLS